MNLMRFFKRPTSSAPVARERLQILLAHERAVVGKSDLIAILQDEIVAVIAKHFPVEPESIKVKMERGDAVSTLEVEVEIPTPMCVGVAKSARTPNPATPNASPLAEAKNAAEKSAPVRAELESLTQVEAPAEAES